MARIIGGIATSHTPTIDFALDTRKQNDHVTSGFRDLNNE
jgi:hypothetical protein